MILHILLYVSILFVVLNLSVVTLFFPGMMGNVTNLTASLCFCESSLHVAVLIFFHTFGLTLVYGISLFYDLQSPSLNLLSSIVGHCL